MSQVLEEIHAKLERLTALTEHLTVVVETRRTLVDGFDARIDKVVTLERALGATALKLAGAKVLTSWVPGAVAGAIAGAVMVWILLQSGVAAAQ